MWPRVSGVAAVRISEGWDVEQIGLEKDKGRHRASVIILIMPSRSPEPHHPVITPFHTLKGSTPSLAHYVSHLPRVLCSDGPVTQEHLKEVAIGAIDDHVVLRDTQEGSHDQINRHIVCPPPSSLTTGIISTAALSDP